MPPEPKELPTVYTGAAEYDEANEKAILTNFRYEKPYHYKTPPRKWPPLSGPFTWHHANNVRDHSRRDWNYMYIYPPQWELGFYGVCWGVENRVPVPRLGSLARVYSPTQIWWYGYHGNYDDRQEDWQWQDGAEAKAAAHVQKHVKEGLLEVPRIAFAHWHHRTNQLGSFDERKIRNREGRQKLRDYVAANVAGSVDRAKAAATVALELEFELDEKFKKAGSDLTKTLAVCNEYITGKFGVNWYCYGYFSYPEGAAEDHPQRKLTAIQDKWISDAELAVDMKRYGESPTHFVHRNLSPLFKRFPVLKSVHHE